MWIVLFTPYMRRLTAVATRYIPLFVPGCPAAVCGQWLCKSIVDYGNSLAKILACLFWRCIWIFTAVFPHIWLNRPLTLFAFQVSYPLNQALFHSFCLLIPNKK
jgi:hypothetical protein